MEEDSKPPDPADRSDKPEPAAELTPEQRGAQLLAQMQRDADAMSIAESQRVEKRG